jgi:hypothetical protein
MNLSYVVGQDSASSLLFQCVVSIQLFHKGEENFTSNRLRNLSVLFKDVCTASSLCIYKQDAIETFSFIGESWKVPIRMKGLLDFFSTIRTKMIHTSLYICLSLSVCARRISPILFNYIQLLHFHSESNRLTLSPWRENIQFRISTIPLPEYRGNGKYGLQFLNGL